MSRSRRNPLADVADFRVEVLNDTCFFRTNYEVFYRRCANAFMLFEPGDEHVLVHISSRFEVDEATGLRLQDEPHLQFEVYWPGLVKIDDRRKIISYGPFRIELLPKNLPLRERLDASEEQEREGRARIAARKSSIYFLQATSGGPIKIGYASNVKERIKNLQVASPVELRPLAVIDGDRTREREIHATLARHRTRGEWFLPDTEVTDFIKSLAPGE